MGRVVVYDYGGEPDTIFYCEAERLPDGTILITDFGRVLEAEPEQKILENSNGPRN